VLTGNNPWPPHNHGGALQPQAARRAHRQHRRNEVTETPPKRQPAPGRGATNRPRPRTRHNFHHPRRGAAAPTAARFFFGPETVEIVLSY
jgi:hypothetical protein